MATAYWRLPQGLSPPEATCNFIFLIIIIVIIVIIIIIVTCCQRLTPLLELLQNLTNRRLHPEEVELLQPAASLPTSHLQVSEEHLFRYEVGTVSV